MKSTRRTSQPRGFALIVTLSLMILLTVIAVGLLTLSSISLRTSSQTTADSVARSNARLAMLLALGELQTTVGVDTAVTASASAVFQAAKRPHLLGAWSATDPADYWHWMPVPGGSPSFDQKAARFKRWLVSTPSPQDAQAFSFGSGTEPNATTGVVLVGDQEDSQKISTRVVAGKVKVSTSQPGRYGWAVFDESAKAAVNLGDPATKQVPGIEIASRNSPNRFRADAIVNDGKLAALSEPVNLISLKTAAIPAPANGNDLEFRRRFHDLTTNTVGLLTNPATGGLKTDLTALFEPDTLPTGAFTAPTLNSPYPDSFSVNSGAPKWSYLQDHYRKYKRMTTDASGETSYALTAPDAKDLTINQAGITAAPDYERLLPVIAKLQIVFSMVAHYNHIQDRVDFYNANGGNTNFGAIHLVYDPVITLYNPYDVSINLDKTRIRIWDPPVGFRFWKVEQSGNKALFRQHGKFEGLALLQIANQTNDKARKCFTLVLSDGTPASSGTSLRLKPGEVKVFSPRVEDNWTWRLEVGTGDGYAPRSFFDWNAGSDFGNSDNRTKTTKDSLGMFGVESVPGWNPRAGLQTDHLALAGQRSPQSLYPFEQAAGTQNGWVAVKTRDEVMVEAKPVVTSADSSKQFIVDVLAAKVVGSSATGPASDSVKSDTLRRYSFSFVGTDPSAEISATPTRAVISRQFRVGDMLQGMDDKTADHKKPFALLEMTARTTKGLLTDSKPWLYNNPVTEGGDQNSNVVGLSNQSYDLRFSEISSLKGFPNGISIDPDTNQGYFGASDSIDNGGSSFVSMLRVPVTPAASLGDLIPANIASSSVLPRVTHPLGNSRAHPLLPVERISQNLAGITMMDHSFLLNDGLWDSYFFSSVSDYTGGSGKVLPTTRNAQDVLRGILDGTEPALNTRLTPVKQVDPAGTAKTIATLKPLDRSRSIAKWLGIKGPFNVNSTSVDAWKAMLMSLRGREINGENVNYSGTTPNRVAKLSPSIYSTAKDTPFVRMSKPLAGSSPTPALLWAGFRTLTDDQIDNLAKNIVVEIQASGAADSAPSFSLGEFVNRRPSSATSVHSLAGLLQTAIDHSNINDQMLARDSRDLAPNFSSKRFTGVRTREVMSGKSAEGAPSMITQGDLMMALAPIATVRGDTFKIRSYGEATTQSGTVTARAWCETIVQRSPEFVDAADTPETPIASLTANANRKFGRRFNVVSFRWLSENEL
jgi:Tfp pilus assembly protein PilV